MTRQSFIDRLQTAINDYQSLHHELREMISDWDDHGDPASDPGMQFEKECEIDRAFTEILRSFATYVIERN